MKKKGRIILFIVLGIILIGGITFIGITVDRMVKEKYKDEIAKKEQLLIEKEKEQAQKELESQKAKEEEDKIEKVDLNDTMVGESLIINDDTLSIKSYVDVENQEEALSIATFIKENLVENNRTMLNKRGVTKIDIILKGTEKSWRLNDNNSIEPAD